MLFILIVQLLHRGSIVGDSQDFRPPLEKWSRSTSRNHRHADEKLSWFDLGVDVVVDGLPGNAMLDLMQHERESVCSKMAMPQHAAKNGPICA